MRPVPSSVATWRLMTRTSLAVRASGTRNQNRVVNGTGMQGNATATGPPLERHGKDDHSRIRAASQCRFALGTIDSVLVNTEPSQVVNPSGSRSDREG